MGLKPTQGGDFMQVKRFEAGKKFYKALCSSRVRPGADPTHPATSVVCCGCQLLSLPSVLCSSAPR
eukprot:4443843-Amphidinium_carterae.1